MSQTVKLSDKEINKELLDLYLKSAKKSVSFIEYCFVHWRNHRYYVGWHSDLNCYFVKKYPRRELPSS